jgi:serine O-acetyltransferase
MNSLIRAYRKNDPAAKSDLEVIFLYPGIKALALHSISHSLYRMKIPFLPRALSEVGRFLTGIEIHPGAQIGRDLVIDHGMGVVIGETSVIGNQCLLYHGVTLGGTALKSEKRHPTVGDRVMIGAGAKLLGNIEIGSDSRIGANAVVVESVPARSTVTGFYGKSTSRGSSEFKGYDEDFVI